MGTRIVTVVVMALLFAGCVSQPQRAEVPTYWVPSKNFDERRPNFVIIHHTGSDTVEQAIRTLTDPAREVSAHYLIGRDGIIYQLVDERARAWHSGQSQWGLTPISIRLRSELNSTIMGESHFLKRRLPRFSRCLTTSNEDMTFRRQIFWVIQI